jgi:hypothetical protein
MTDDLKKELASNLKEAALKAAEGTARDFLEVALDSVEKLAKESENKVDDMFLAFLPLARPMILDLIDKIYKEEDFQDPPAEAPAPEAPKV